MEKRRRKLRNLLISPDTQLKYGLFFLTLAILIHAVFTVVSVNLFFEWSNGNIEVSGWPIGFLIGASIVIYFLVLAGALFLGLLLSHRVLGPMVPILRFLDKLKAGDYSARITLRRGDEPKLREVADRLNELAAQLEIKRQISGS